MEEDPLSKRNWRIRKEEEKAKQEKPCGVLVTCNDKDLSMLQVEKIRMSLSH